MVALFVKGVKIGTLAEAETLLPKFLKDNVPIEMRDEPSGEKLGVIQPEPIVPWEPAVTREQLEARKSAPGSMKLADFWKQMGAQ